VPLEKRNCGPQSGTFSQYYDLLVNDGILRDSPPPFSICIHKWGPRASPYELCGPKLHTSPQRGCVSEQVRRQYTCYLYKREREMRLIVPHKPDDFRQLFFL
jgi:hypothetical protein